jgi:hypothetical protein
MEKRLWFAFLLIYLDEVDTPVLEKLSIGMKTLLGRKLHCGTISHVEINTPTPMNQPICDL